jgi:hypothetical protein
MHAPVKYLEKGLSHAANGFWSVFQLVYRLKRNPSFTPRWSDKPLLKSWEKTLNAEKTAMNTTPIPTLTR